LKPPGNLRPASGCPRACSRFSRSACNVCAHNPSKSYLSLTCDTNGITGQWDIPLADLQSAVPLDSNHDGNHHLEELSAGYGAATTMRWRTWP